MKNIEMSDLKKLYFPGGLFRTLLNHRWDRWKTSAYPGFYWFRIFILHDSLRSLQVFYSSIFSYFLGHSKGLLSFWVKFFLLFFPVIIEYSNRNNKLTFIFSHLIPNASFSLFNTPMIYFFEDCWSSFLIIIQKKFIYHLKKF